MDDLLAPPDRSRDRGRCRRAGRDATVCERGGLKLPNRPLPKDKTAC
jgi:hypothetical protein